MNASLLFTGPDHKDNWCYNRWYCSGGNSRYYTWQLVFNLLSQRSDPSATIVETGCQRLKSDIGGGESSTIFCEYISRYGGKLISVDNSPHSIKAAEECTAAYQIEKKFHLSDSVAFLQQYKGPCDLVYLDSYDYPYGELLNAFGGEKDVEVAEEKLMKLTRTEIDSLFGSVITPCQQHCLNELNAIESKLQEDSIILIDDNQLPGGGKPRLSKEYLLDKGWTCLLDFQQTVWVRSL